MEKIIINFNENDLKSNYEDLIYGALSKHLVLDRSVQYIFPQIKNWWVWLKCRIATKIAKLPIKWEYNIWFVSTQTEQALFKIIILQ